MSIFHSRTGELVRNVKLILAICLLVLVSCKKIGGELEIKILSGTVTEQGYDFCIVEGEIVDLGNGGITQYGFCYGESENPSITDLRTQLGSRTALGQFSDTLNGLECSTTYFIRAYATNQSGTVYGSQVAFNTSNCRPVVTTTSITNITQTSAQSGGTVPDDGGGDVIAKGVCWSTSPDPTISDDHTTEGSGTGAFTGILSGLSCGTSYYVRAYATNSSGTAYGEELTFSTSPCIYTLPVIVTAEVENITDVSATGGGNVTDDGGDSDTQRGICWSTWHTPTTDHDHTSDGAGAGIFSSIISGLEPTTTYFVRAYATNSEGTSYGEVVEFITLSEVVSDVDGNTYPVIELGTQKWMAENLRTTKFNDGNPIAYATDNNRQVDNYCWYNHDDSNAELYGALYNARVACSDSLCPVGWHIPTRGEWQTLNSYLSSWWGGGNGAKAMASATGWDFYATEGTVGYDQGSNNSSGFNAQPAGFLFGGSGFTFKDQGRRTLWYTKGELPIDYETQYSVGLGNWMNQFDSQGSSGYCEMKPCFWPSFSIRCVKD